MVCVALSTGAKYRDRMGSDGQPFEVGVRGLLLSPARHRLQSCIRPSGYNFAFAYLREQFKTYH